MASTLRNPSVMRALLVREAGWPNRMQVEEMPLPSISADSVLVRVRAAGLNFADKLVVQGNYQERHVLPFVPGAELVGDVVDRGSEVRNVSIGDRVMGQVAVGAYSHLSTDALAAAVGAIGQKITQPHKRKPA